MRYGRHLFIGFLALLLGGCGTTVQESLKVPATSKIPVCGNKTVVVLPFADYSQADNLETAYRRNLFVAENLTDQFSKYGYRLPVQEDVFRYLTNQKIINAVPDEGSRTATVEEEMRKDWSGPMKQRLQHYIDQAKSARSQGDESNSPGTHGLTQQEIVKIGRHFSGDYIVRGRIIQYKERQDPSWNPLKKGVITFVTGVNSRLAFGQAESRHYDEWNQTLAGAADGALISGLATNWDAGPTIAWSGAGAVLGNLANHSGVIPQAVVQLRVWVQDAYTGNVVWTNRVDVKVSPESVLADYQYDALFEKATEKGITTLVEDFAQAVCRPAPVAAPVSPDTDKDGVPDVADHCPNTPPGVPVNALGCPAKENLILEGVNFDFDSAVLTGGSQQILNRTASALINAPQVKVEVAGFTDSVGDPQYNVKLSNERSLAVVRYLTGKGVAAKQLTATGYGEEFPVADNATPEGRQKNRRTELRPITP